MVKERIGLQRTANGFSLFEVFGQLERNMLPGEKVADAMFKWEKYARSTHSPKILKLTFKVALITICDKMAVYKMNALISRNGCSRSRTSTLVTPSKPTFSSTRQ